MQSGPVQQFPGSNMLYQLQAAIPTKHTSKITLGIVLQDLQYDIGFIVLTLTVSLFEMQGYVCCWQQDIFLLQMNFMTGKW